MGRVRQKLPKSRVEISLGILETDVAGCKNPADDFGQAQALGESETAPRVRETLFPALPGRGTLDIQKAGARRPPFRLLPRSLLIHALSAPKRRACRTRFCA